MEAGSRELARIGANRRHDWLGGEARRFPLRLPFTYQIRGIAQQENVNASGSGRTLNMSSAQVVVETDRPLSVGMEADLAIAWPATLSESVALTLRIRGRIVSVNECTASLAVTRHEFRTRPWSAGSERGK